MTPPRAVRGCRAPPVFKNEAVMWKIYDRILEILARSGESGMTEVAAALTVHKSTAFRLVATLEQHRLVEQTEAAGGPALTVVSGGNSASLEWALSTDRPGRTNELRLGEAVLLGTEPSGRTPIPGLHTDAFTLVGEVIEVADKPARPWGTQAQAAYGVPPARTGTSTLRQAIVALGRQEVARRGGEELPHRVVLPGRRVGDVDDDVGTGHHLGQALAGDGVDARGGRRRHGVVPLRD